MTNKDFLNWIADRLVHVHGESDNVDFVIRLRAMAENQKLNVPSFVDGSKLTDLINSETHEYLRGFACGANWMIDEVKRINKGTKE